MKKYKIVYWYNGNKYLAETKAESIQQAKYWFYMNIPNDDIIEIEEEVDNV